MKAMSVFTATLLLIALALLISLILVLILQAAELYYNCAKLCKGNYCADPVHWKCVCLPYEARLKRR